MTKREYLQELEEVIERGPYKPEWSSLCDFEMPKWFEKAKFGMTANVKFQASAFGHKNNYQPLMFSLIQNKA